LCAIVTKREAGSGGRESRETISAVTYDEAAWSCPLDAGVNPRVKSPGGRWLKSPTHRGERRVSRQTIAQGMPDCFGEPVVTVPVVVCSFHPGPRVRRAPGIPCALFTSKGARFPQNPGAIARRQCGTVLAGCPAGADMR